MIQFTKTDGVYALSILNAQFKNALSLSVLQAMRTALKECVEDDHCKCIVIEGSNGTFSSGRMLSEGPSSATLEAYIQFDTVWAEIIQLLSITNIPSLAIVDGYAVAGGFTLAMACDFVVATETARFGALEMRGGFPASINAAVLAHKAPPRIALQYLLSKETFGAPELFRHGLINTLATDAVELARVGRAFATDLAALDATAARLTKEHFRVCQEASLHGAIGLGRQQNSLMMASGKVAEAARLFAKK